MRLVTIQIRQWFFEDFMHLHSTCQIPLRFYGPCYNGVYHATKPKTFSHFKCTLDIPAGIQYSPQTWASHSIALIPPPKIHSWIQLNISLLPDIRGKKNWWMNFNLASMVPVLGNNLTASPFPLPFLLFAACFCGEQRTFTGRMTVCSRDTPSPRSTNLSASTRLWAVSVTAQDALPSTNAGSHSLSVVWMYICPVVLTGRCWLWVPDVCPAEMPVGLWEPRRLRWGTANLVHRAE